MSLDSRAALRLTSPADLVACVPYLLGFHPSDSVVMIAVHDGHIRFTARGDLPERAAVTAAVDHLFEVLSRQQCDRLAAVGYGAAGRVDPVLSAVRAAAARRGLPLLDLLRVTAGRWFSHTCANPACCPPEGTPLDIAASPVAAAFAYAGAAALPDRAALERQVAPVGGRARLAMTRATGRAEAELGAWVAALPAPERAGAVRAAGATALHDAIERYGAGGRFDDDQMARLTVLLTTPSVREAAWAATTEEEPHVRLWTDVVRRVEPRLVSAPACLLGVAAWRAGNGALAAMALERALREDPADRVAAVLLDGLAHGLPPSVLDRPGRRHGTRRAG
jgi:hypothetical protein